MKEFSLKLPLSVDVEVIGENKIVDEFAKAYGSKDFPDKTDLELLINHLENGRLKVKSAEIPNFCKFIENGEKKNK